MSIRPALTRLRTEPLIHWVGLVVAIAVGLAAAGIHWLGLVVAGGLLGIVATTLKRALLAGLGFGVFVLTIWGGTLFLGGDLGAVVASGQFAGLAVLIGLAGPLLGSLVRGVV